MDSPDHASLPLMDHLMKINHRACLEKSNQAFDGWELQEFTTCHAIFKKNRRG